VDLSGPVLDQLVAAEIFDSLDEITARRLAELRPQRDALLAALAHELPQWQVAEPQGGLSLWIELDAPMSTPLTLLAAQAGVSLVPGSRFGIDGTLERFLRLPFSLPAPRLTDAVHRLAAVWAQLDKSGLAGRQLVVA
jgi:DNA-binding transcriptional MocR family regulator